jgi:uncharacterized membrane protein
MRLLYLASVWLHLLAVVVWLGGMLFLAVAIVPLLRQPEYQSLRFSMLNWMGVRFRWIGWICLLLLVVTGIANLAYRGYGWGDLGSGRLWQGSFGHALGIKLVLVSIIFLLSAVHDFRVGPRATMVGQTKPGSPEALRIRKQATWIGRLNVILALLVITLGIILVRGSL